MQGDFSRLTFDSARHFSAVLAQQGRVQLDADGNEQAQILLHHLRQLAADLIGPAGVPRDPTKQNDPGGFQITLTADSDPADFTISAGRMYVDGILLENDPPGTGTTATYWNQPDGHLDQATKGDQLPARPYLVYVRVWERLITAVEDPGIREIALGDFGPDTAARARIVWQVAAHSLTSDEIESKQWLRWRHQFYEPRSELTARAKRPADASQNVCDVAPGASYTGTENQLYRVEVHNGGEAAVVGTTGKITGTGATFKWSRENASVVFPIVPPAAAEVEVATLGHDGKLGLEVGDWVEVVDDAYASRLADDVPVRPLPPLNRVVAIDPADRLITLDREPGSGWPGLGANPALHPLLRRWDHPATAHSEAGDLNVAADGALPVIEDSWIDLEDGVQIRFEPAVQSAGTVVPRKYRRGDYWLIPARTIPGDVLWPQDANGPVARAPDGVEYHYAPLAYAAPGATGLNDLRMIIEPLAKAQ
jgi:uncharacterized protein DUF6519